MPKDIVDRLKAVKVEPQQGKSSASFGLRQRLFKALLE